MQSPEKGNPGCGTGAGEMNEGIFNNTPIPPESQAFSDKTGPGVATAMSNKLTMLSVHLADLQQSGLTDETIRAAGLYTVPPDDIGKKLGGNDSGILSLLAFPYPGCEGHERFKCFYEEGKSGPKYRQKKETPNRLYLPPAADPLTDGPLVIAEGEKKCLALWQAGYEVVGISGVWNWCQKGEGYRKPKESRPIPDLDRVNWRRPVTIIFDSDGHDKFMVRLAAFRLARELSRMGAAVSILFGSICVKYGNMIVFIQHADFVGGFL